ncbi:MAG: phenylalanine--tRNA ligase subunit beta [Gammaproteobacteria bacterium]
MKLSANWLRDLADPGVDNAELARRLTMAGLMVDAVTPAGPPLTDIVAGRVVTCTPHPDADKLTVCEVDTGGARHTIVCGASNARVDLVAPVALPGTTLPDGTTIAATELRGVRSDGMLCSGRELRLSDDHEGLLELPADTKPGAAVAQVLALADEVFEFDLTPNRGDCLSALGIAREVSALFELSAPAFEAAAVPATHKDALKVALDDPSDCGVYCGRIVRDVDTMRASPVWLQERLRRSGIRPRGIAVDVAAFVMLETGQPLHMFDLAKLDGDIRVRRAKKGEPLTLLDGTDVVLDDEVLVIADKAQAVAMAGVMGGEATAVGDGTRDVFIESAWFEPRVIAGRARRFGLHTDASHRYERGVDPALAPLALERATALLVTLAGGEPGPVTTAGKSLNGYRDTAIELRRARVAHLLGIEIEDKTIAALLRRLHFDVADADAGWRVRVPSYRFDIAIEADLIEEVARLYGYDRIPAGAASTPMTMQPAPETRVSDRVLTDTLVHRGFQQVITYSFVDGALQRRLGLDDGALPLANPISSELGTMRTSLWPGLVDCLGYNANRQQSRVRIFEIGLRFIQQVSELQQEKVIAGLIWGDRHPVQWGAPAAPVDFYDLKADCAALFGRRVVTFEAATHPSLHPGQSARVVLDGAPIGWIGTLHPQHAAALDLARPPILFELAVAPVVTRAAPQGRPVSRFPGLRRDLALVVPEGVTVGALLAEVDRMDPGWLQERFVFDIYRGAGVEAGLKSIALGLILQETSRTLTDGEADAFVQRLVAHLGDTVRATLRD